MAKSLGNILETQQKVEIYAYALEMLFMVIINLILVLLAAFYLQIVPTTLAFLAVFIPFRGFEGGVHMSTFPRCLVVGSSLMLCSAYFASAENMYPFLLEILFVVALMFVLICAIKWVPAIGSQAVRQRKHKMLIAVFLWAGCVSNLVYCHYNDLALAMILGAIMSSMLVSPSGYRLMGFIDRSLNYLRRGVFNS
jgi:Accessory gene regulator B.